MREEQCTISMLSMADRSSGEATGISFFSLFRLYVVLNRTLKRIKDTMTKTSMLFTREVILQLS